MLALFCWVLNLVVSQQVISVSNDKTLFFFRGQWKFRFQNSKDLKQVWSIAELLKSPFTAVLWLLSDSSSATRGILRGWNGLVVPLGSLNTRPSFLTYMPVSSLNSFIQTQLLWSSFHSELGMKPTGRLIKSGDWTVAYAVGVRRCLAVVSGSRKVSIYFCF